MPPSGVPVCLTEKTKGCHCGGVCLAKILEPAGLSGPVPMPTSTAAPIATGQKGRALASPRPSTPTNKATWQVRMTP